jgi:hypothetical protein
MNPLKRIWKWLCIYGSYPKWYHIVVYYFLMINTVDASFWDRFKTKRSW